MLSIVKDYLNHYLLRPASGISPALARDIGSVLGNFEASTNPEIFKVAKAIHEVTNGHFSSSESRKISRKWIINRYHNWVDLHYLLKSDRSVVNQIFHCKNIEELDKGFARGKGVILATFHIGCYELIGYRLLNHYNKRLAALATDALKKEKKYIKRKVLSAIVQSRTESLQIIEVPSPNAVRQTLNWLKDNGMYYLALDHYEGGEKLIKTQLFGQPTYLPRGCAQLALKTGAVVIPIATIRQPDLTHEIRFMKSVEFDSSLNTQDALEARFQEIINQLEEAILEHPELLITWTDHALFRTLSQEYKRDKV